MRVFALLGTMAAPATLAAASSSAAQPAPAIMPDFTRPILDFDCKLRNRQHNVIDFSFRVSGGRMVLSDGTFGGYTPRTVEVLRDPSGMTGRFPDQYVNMAHETADEFKVGFGWEEDGSFRIGLDLDVHRISGRDDVRLVVVDDGRSASFPAVGLCDFQTIAQSAVREGPPSQ